MNQHAPFLHPYDGMIPLSVAGYILGTVLLLAHLYALVKRQQVQAFLLASPRNHLLAQILLAGGLFWFFLLVAPEGLGAPAGMPRLSGADGHAGEKPALSTGAGHLRPDGGSSPAQCRLPSGASDQAPYSHLVLHRHFPFDSLDRQALPVPRHGQ